MGELVHQQMLLQRSILCLVSTNLTGALRKWREVAAELKECARLAGGALNRMLKRQLSRAWEQWQQVATESREQMELLRRGVMRMLQRQLSMGFLKWRASDVRAVTSALTPGVTGRQRWGPRS